MQGQGGIVYFLKSGKKGPVKIGWTGNIDRRYSELWAGAPDTLTLVGALIGTMTLEKAIHRRFRGCKVKHKQEWFELKPILVDFLAELGGSEDHDALLAKWDIAVK